MLSSTYLGGLSAYRKPFLQCILSFSLVAKDPTRFFFGYLQHFFSRQVEARRKKNGFSSFRFFEDDHFQGWNRRSYQVSNKFYEIHSLGTLIVSAHNVGDLRRSGTSLLGFIGASILSTSGGGDGVALLSDFVDFSRDLFFLEQSDKCFFRFQLAKLQMFFAVQPL